jgi:periplasmic divalent cation tolerance protein
MSEPMLAMMTAPGLDEARRIAGILVDEGLAACCNLIGQVESIYRWQGEVERAEEVLVIVKTTANRLKALKRRIAELHSYDVPEFIAIPITDGLPPYLRWLAESVGDVEG